MALSAHVFGLRSFAKHPMRGHKKMPTLHEQMQSGNGRSQFYYLTMKLSLALSITYCLFTLQKKQYSTRSDLAGIYKYFCLNKSIFNLTPF